MGVDHKVTWEIRRGEQEMWRKVCESGGKGMINVP